MSLLSGIIGGTLHGVGNVIDNITPGAGQGVITNTGKAITNPKQVLSNPGGIFTKAPAFTAVGGAAGGGGGSSGGVSPDNPMVLGASTTYGASGGGTGGSGSGGGTSVNPADVAAYQDQLNSLQNLLAQADIARQNGLSAYDQSYNNGLAGLNQSQSNVLQGYNTQRQDATGDYQKTLGQIDTNARNGYNGLMALLGGSGSAGTILAPFAVSQQANQQRSGAQDSFAKNLRNLDTATGQANQDYQNKLNDLLTQKNSGIQKLISDIDAQKQNYLNQIAATQNQLRIAKGGGYTSPTATQAQIQALQSEQNNLQNQYATPTLQVDPVTGQPVDLSQYQAQAAQLADNNNNPADQSTDPASALAALLKQNQDPNTPAFTY